MRTVIGYLVPLVEAFGALVIMLGAIRTVVQYLRVFFGHGPAHAPSLRIQLGQSMVMGLEFFVAADILRTALSPTWNEMLLLAALIGLRTVLNYFVERELGALGIDVACSTRKDPSSGVSVGETGEQRRGP